MDRPADMGGQAELFEQDVQGDIRRPVVRPYLLAQIDGCRTGTADHVGTGAPGAARALEEAEHVIRLGASSQDQPRLLRYAAAENQVRSEEHTSELQSLMRTPYAVFCLKKKKHTNNL